MRKLILKNRVALTTPPAVQSFRLVPIFSQKTLQRYEIILNYQTKNKEKGTKAKRTLNMGKRQAYE